DAGLDLGLRRALPEGGAAGDVLRCGPQAAASMDSAWPVTETLRTASLIFPSGPITNVERSIPMNLRPYSIFDFHTPYARQIVLSSSTSSGNGRPCLALKPACDFAESALTPKMGTFFLANA